MDIKVIIFDWHGVLDETKMDSLLTKLTQLTKMRPDEVEPVLKTYEQPYGKGDITPQDFWANIKRAFHFTQSQLQEAQQSILVFRKYKPLWDMLPELRMKYTLAVLSDCPLDKARIIRSEADLSPFKTVYFSAEKRLTKNSKDFYNSILNELSVEPQACLYFDDNKQHIATAAELGLRSCYFRGIESFRNCLSLH